MASLLNTAEAAKVMAMNSWDSSVKELEKTRADAAEVVSNSVSQATMVPLVMA